MLEEDKILEIYEKSIKFEINNVDEPDPQFTLRDLIGEKIINIREIYRGRNKTPNFLDVICFESGRTLITGVEGWHDGSTYHQYLIERDGSIKYTHCLFENYFREQNIKM